MTLPDYPTEPIMCRSVITKRPAPPDLDTIMRQMGWKPHWKSTAKCAYRGCDNLRAGDLLCLWHKGHPDGRRIDRSIT